MTKAEQKTPRSCEERGAVVGVAQLAQSARFVIGRLRVRTPPSTPPSWFAVPPREPSNAAPSIRAV